MKKALCDSKNYSYNLHMLAHTILHNTFNLHNS